MKTRIKYLLSVIIILLCFCSCSVKSPDEYYSSSNIEDGITVTVSINCSVILDNMDNLEESLKPIIPQDGVILTDTEVLVKENSTVFDALSQACRQNKIHFEYTGTDADTYIEGIANIYEFSCGPLSGWEYTVNGDFLSLGCNNIELNDGDKVQFIYTCDLGRDIGNGYTGE